MADHQIPRISFTFDTYSCPVGFALFFIPTPSTRWKVHVTSKGLLGIRASPVSVAGFPQDSDMFPVSRWLISHLKMESLGQNRRDVNGPSEPTRITSLLRVTAYEQKPLIRRLHRLT